MRSQSIPPHVVATRHLLTPSPLSPGSAPQHPTIGHAAPDDTQRTVPGAQAGPDQQPPTPDDGIASSLHRFSDPPDAGGGAAQRPGLFAQRCPGALQDRHERFDLRPERTHQEQARVGAGGAGPHLG